nr:MAG TPA: hypothetical protein [Caudoviricetes sp.]
MTKENTKGKIYKKRNELSSSLIIVKIGVLCWLHMLPFFIYRFDR